MPEPEEIKTETEDQGLLSKVGGLGQKIIGEIETLVGVVNADPLAQAEGEFNVEVGEIREELEEDLGNEDETTAAR
ncbi:MAG: hypothetical protein HOP17_11800 [Acidobacteria bacterium]|nr:hypothetical protein [Acidobacteriota bacterium]